MKYLVKYVVAGGEYNYEATHEFESEPTPDKILEALRAYGLSWELEESDTEIYEINHKHSGPELVRLFGPKAEC